MKYPKVGDIAPPAFHLTANPSSSEDLVDNPAWLARVVTTHMDALRGAVPAQWLPELGKFRATGRGNHVKAELEQLGCGVYGCVLPTGDPGVVCKITQDTTEVDFVRKVLPNITPAGITAYYATTDLGKTPRTRGKSYPVYALWREAADGIGAVSGEAGELLDVAHQISDQIYRVLHDARDDAGDLYEAARTFKMSQGQGAARDLYEEFTDLVVAWKRIAESDELHYVGVALLEFLRAGVLIADVHAGNVGHVTREGADLVVITDPGHAAILPAPWPFLTPRFSAVLSVW